MRFTRRVETILRAQLGPARWARRTLRLERMVATANKGLEAGGLLRTEQAAKHSATPYLSMLLPEGFA